MDKGAVHQFAEEYLRNYAGNVPPLPTAFIRNENFGVQCGALGFVMDGGRAFMKRYGRSAFETARGLVYCINRVDDAALLGSAIYSRWQREKDRHYAPSFWGEGKEEEVEQWFFFAFLQLFVITEDEENQGTYPASLEKIRLVNTIGLYLMPDEGELFQQKLVLHADGRVKFTEYGYTPGDGTPEILRRKSFRLNREKADYLMQLFILLMRAEIFKQAVQLHDRGCWKLTLYGPQGETAFFTSGTLWLFGLICVCDFSKVLRKELGVWEFWAFDEGMGSQYDPLKIHMTYRFDGDDASGAPARKEVLLIDGEKDCIIWRCKSGEQKCKSVLYGGVDELLAQCADIIMAPEDIPAADLMPPPVILGGGKQARPSGRYRLTVHYRYAPKSVWKGNFQEDELPAFWPEFAEALRNFCRDTSHSRILDEALYLWRPAQEGELIYCKVRFEDSGRTYYYRTEDDTLRPGDCVLVPTGKETEPQLARIVSMECCRPDEAPYPPEKTKWIQRKLD